MRIYHVAFVVTSLETARRFAERLGLPVSPVEEDAVDRFRGFVATADGVKLLFMEPTDPDGPVGRHLARRGEGFHHLAFQVPDCRAARATLAARGVRFFGAEPREQSYEVAAFIRPESAAGILVELVQPKG